MSRQLSHLKHKEGGRDEAEVMEVTASQKIIRHVVDIQNHTCTCREWQVSGKPCGHALLPSLSKRDMVKPLPDKSPWVKVDPGIKVLPPLSKRDVGRQRKKRIPSCTENKGNKPASGKGMW